MLFHIFLHHSVLVGTEALSHFQLVCTWYLHHLPLKTPQWMGASWHGINLTSFSGVMHQSLDTGYLLFEGSSGLVRYFCEGKKCYSQSYWQRQLFRGVWNLYHNPCQASRLYLFSSLSRWKMIQIHLFSTNFRDTPSCIQDKTEFLKILRSA